MDTGNALVEALLFGRLEGLSEETVFLFARTGLIHLFSASGFHLWSAVLVADLLAQTVLPFLAHARARDSVRFAARLLLMIFFGCATDWSSPMVRAFVFATLCSGAKLMEVRSDRHWIFLLSLLCSAVLGKSGTLSFLLSACGMAGVLYIQPRNALALTLGPWLFTLPLTILNFGLFPLLAPVWNLSFGLAISWLVLPPAILSLVMRSIGLPTLWIDESAGWLMVQLTAWLGSAAEAAGGVFWIRPWPWLLLAGVFFFCRFLWRRRKHMAALCLSASAAISAQLLPWPAVALLDVGQGDALLLRTAHGLLLSDVGPPGFKTTAPVSRSLEKLGIGELDDVLLSHFDLDHRGGLGSLTARHRIRGALWFREENMFEKHGAEVLAAAERAGVAIRFLRTGIAPPGLECWIAPYQRGNDSSPLCRAQAAGGFSVLLTGDMSTRVESWYLHRLRPFPTAEVLKVAHHGSRTSSSAQFLQSSGARIALIGVGARNRYRHPSMETLARLGELQMKISRTDEGGTVTFFPWRSVLGYLGSASKAGTFTEEITRVTAGTSLVKPGRPAPARRVYAEPASSE